MIVLIGSEKGGTGKTTLAVNIAVALAAAGRDVVLVDADPQASAARWAERRSEQQSDRPPVHCVQRTGNVYKTIVDLAGRYAEVIVDAGGRDSHELRSAMLAAHRVLVPARPSQLDLEAALHVDELAQAASASRTDGGPALTAVLSQCPTHHMNSETEAARGYLEQFTSMRLATSRVSERKAFRDAITAGLGVIEIDNRAAADEIQALVSEIYG